MLNNVARETDAIPCHKTDEVCKLYDQKYRSTSNRVTSVQLNKELRLRVRVNDCQNPRFSTAKIQNRVFIYFEKSSDPFI